MSIFVLMMFFQFHSDSKNFTVYFYKEGIISPFNYLNKDTVMRKFTIYLKENTLSDSYYVELNIDLIGIIVKMSRYYEKKLNKLKNEIKSTGEGIEHPEKFLIAPPPTESLEENIGSVIFGLSCCLIGYTINAIHYWASVQEFKEISKKAQWIYRKIILAKIKVFKGNDTLYSERFVFIKDKVKPLPSTPLLLKNDVKEEFKELMKEFVNYLNFKLENVKYK